MPTFEMTDRMLLAESIGTGRVELENIFIYQYITFLFGSLELHRQLFPAQSSRDCWAIGWDNLTNDEGSCRVVEIPGAGSGCR
ncbi:hypothetical protein [Rhizobium leguminosarum]|jgi:hypothetical protein|uniref:hypothetical protein n=1 Tax=Rhizobium leguminosarum TaxID=384 RepID=UPI001C91AAAF|nr:hypothetical protein [Rhizobium leguminosarum]MBY3041479.1 hypothetical protein [Rhizobium leguminosarum]